MKQEFASIYENYLPKGLKPFIYVNIQANPNNLDVNVHPTKNEVRILKEDTIIDELKKVMIDKLLQTNASKVFATQTHISSALTSNDAATAHTTSSAPNKDTIAPSLKVRTEEQQGQMDNYVNTKKRPMPEAATSIQPPLKKRKTDKEELASVQILLEQVQKESSSDLLQLMKQSVYVGWIHAGASLIQYETQLYIVNMIHLRYCTYITQLSQFSSKSLVYQLVLNNFQEFPKLRFSNPLHTPTLVKSYFELEGNGKDDMTELAEQQTESLLQERKRLMLDDYFSIEIDENGNLCAIPQIIPNYCPPLHRVPEFLFNLATKVLWTSEEDCFKSVAECLSQFFALAENYELETADSMNRASLTIV